MSQSKTTTRSKDPSTTTQVAKSNASASTGSVPKQTAKPSPVQQPAQQPATKSVAANKQPAPKQQTAAKPTPTNVFPSDQPKGSVKLTSADAKKLTTAVPKPTAEVPKSTTSKGKAPNNATALIGGTFNVLRAKDSLNDYITKRLGYNDIGLKHAHYVYAALTESIALFIVRECEQYCVKNQSKGDLYDVTYENIQRGIREKKYFGPMMVSLSESYDPNSSYVGKFFDNEKVMQDFLVQNVFVNKTNVAIDNNAVNFVCYVVMHIMETLTRTACLFSLFVGHKNISIKNFEYACTIHFTGELCAKLNGRISEVKDIIKANALTLKAKSESADKKNVDAQQTDAEGEEEIEVIEQKVEEIEEVEGEEEFVEEEEEEEIVEEEAEGDEVVE